MLFNLVRLQGLEPRTCALSALLFPVELQAHTLAPAVSFLGPIVGPVNACFQKPFNF